MAQMELTKKFMQMMGEDMVSSKASVLNTSESKSQPITSMLSPFPSIPYQQGVVVTKFMIEIQTYPNGNTYQKIYPIGRSIQNKPKKQKAKNEAKAVKNEEEVL